MNDMQALRAVLRETWMERRKNFGQAKEVAEKREKTLAPVAAQNPRSVFTATYRAATKGSGAACDFSAISNACPTN
jgi:hypothetical protein